MKAVFLIAALLLASPIRGQATFQVNAGGGNLLTGGAFAEGIGLTTYFPNNTVYTGLAVRDGHFILGASDTFMFHETTVVAGDQMIGLTTVNVGLGLALKGVSIRRQRELQCTDAPRPIKSRGPLGYTGWRCSGGWALTMFSGATGDGIFLPFQRYARPQHLGAGVLAQQRLRDFQFSGLGVLEGGQRTLIGAVDYNFRQRILAAGSAGWLNSQRYAQGQILFQPIRFVSLYGTHQSFFLPVPATGSGLGASTAIGRITAQAGWNESNSNGLRVTGKSFGAGIRLVSWLSERSDFYKTSNGQTLLVHTITETMRRWSFTEAVNQLAGRNSYSYGASFHSNRLSVSLGHSVQFLLGGRGYQQVLGISVSFRVHDSIFDANTVSNPVTGKTLWNVGGEQYIQAGNLSLPGHEAHSTGKHLIAGRCVLEDGTPQEGCAVVIGKEFVYSNSHGEFQSHQNKKTAYVMVSADEFSAPGRWQIVEAPTSTVEEGSPVRVVVRKVFMSAAQAPRDSHHPQ